MGKHKFRRHVNGAEDFWTVVDCSGDGCWEWQGQRASGERTDRPGKRKMPYGMARIGISPNYKDVMAHRLAWEYAVGPIPEGMKVLHSCDNPPCCRPDHLFLGTQSDNMKDAAGKGRLAFNLPETPISKEKALKIRAAWESSDKKHGMKTIIARQFGVNPGIVFYLTRIEVIGEMPDWGA